MGMAGMNAGAGGSDDILDPSGDQGLLGCRDIGNLRTGSERLRALELARRPLIVVLLRVKDALLKMQPGGIGQVAQPGFEHLRAQLGRALRPGTPARPANRGLRFSARALPLPGMSSRPLRFGDRPRTPE